MHFILNTFDTFFKKINLYTIINNNCVVFFYNLFNLDMLIFIQSKYIIFSLKGTYNLINI